MYFNIHFLFSITQSFFLIKQTPYIILSAFHHLTLCMRTSASFTFTQPDVLFSWCLSRSPRSLWVLNGQLKFWCSTVDLVWKLSSDCHSFHCRFTPTCSHCWQTSTITDSTNGKCCIRLLIISASSRIKTLLVNVEESGSGSYNGICSGSAKYFRKTELMKMYHHFLIRSTFYSENVRFDLTSFNIAFSETCLVTQCNKGGIVLVRSWIARISSTFIFCVPPVNMECIMRNESVCFQILTWKAERANTPQHATEHAIINGHKGQRSSLSLGLLWKQILFILKV